MSAWPDDRAEIGAGGLPQVRTGGDGFPPVGIGGGLPSGGTGEGGLSSAGTGGDGRSSVGVSGSGFEPVGIGGGLPSGGTGEGGLSSAGTGGGGFDEALRAGLDAAALALARRVAGGGTLRCLAPGRPEHARNAAAEFAHPVVDGGRGLPAVAVTGPDPLAELRAEVRPGDVILALAAAGDPVVGRVLRRAPIWGAATVWIGTGPRPPAGAADHVLWPDDSGSRPPAAGRLPRLDGPDSRPPAGGGVSRSADPGPRPEATDRAALLCRSLREAVHDRLGRAELLAVPESRAGECVGEVCITCSDEGRLGEVVAPAADGRALVRTETGQEVVDTLLVAPVTTGDLVLVHAGAAITRIDEAAAR